MNSDDSLAQLIAQSKARLESLDWERRRVAAKIAVEHQRFSKLCASAGLPPPIKPQEAQR